MHDVTLRQASLADCELLYRWRNDAETRAASHTTAEIPFDEHRKWLVQVLGDPTKTPYIAEHNGSTVGTVRAELRDGVHELSWTVAPESRGRRFGAAMVAMMAASIDGPIRAEVKAGNR